MSSKSLDQLKKIVEAESEFRNYNFGLRALYHFLIEETNEETAIEFITNPNYGGYSKSELSNLTATIKYQRKYQKEKYHKNKAYNQVQAF